MDFRYTLALALIALVGCPDSDLPPESLPDAGPAPWVPGPTAEPFEPTRVELNWRMATTGERNARMDRRLFRGPEELPALGLDRPLDQRIRLEVHLIGSRHPGAWSG